MLDEKETEREAPQETGTQGFKALPAAASVEMSDRSCGRLPAFSAPENLWAAPSPFKLVKTSGTKRGTTSTPTPAEVN